MLACTLKIWLRNIVSSLYDHIQHVTGDKEDSSVTEAYSDPPQCSQEVVRKHTGTCTSTGCIVAAQQVAMHIMIIHVVCIPLPIVSFSFTARNTTKGYQYNASFTTHAEPTRAGMYNIHM